jgi:hypothetical protein
MLKCLHIVIEGVVPCPLLSTTENDKKSQFVSCTLASLRRIAIQALAMLELKTAVAILMSRFTFRLASEMGGVQGVRDSEVMALTLHTKSGIRMHCHPRDI